MIVVKIVGGLGNQIFQYAFGLVISERYHEDLYLDTSFYTNKTDRTFELDFYNVPYRAKGTYKLYNRIRSYLRKVPMIRTFLGEISEKSEFLYDKRVTKRAYKYYIGYWQNIEYIKPIKKRLLDYFAFPGELTKEQRLVVKEILEGESVAVHIRHGDYQTPYFKDIYCILSERYYRKAMEYVKKQYKNTDVKFYFFSDDIEWCKKTFADIENSGFIDENISGDVHVDFMLMRKCKHIITANSTFSWWAAWLKEQEGIVIVPSKWYWDEKKNSELIRALIEPDWMMIDDN